MPVPALPMNSDEYARLHQLSATHWWHASLHERLLSELHAHFDGAKALRILDLGCGPGSFLRLLGAFQYAASGLDISADAISRCAELGLNAQQGDITDFHWANPASLDALFCLDSAYFFRGEQFSVFLRHAAEAIAPGGALFLHGPALSVFAGKHDKLVGIENRSSVPEFRAALDPHLWKIERLEYRYFLLSPLTFLSRKLGSERDYRAHSKALNAAMRGICVLEDRVLGGWRPWGSSVYLRARRTSAS